MHTVHELGVLEGVQSDGLLHLLTRVELRLGQDPLVVRPEESSCLMRGGEGEGRGGEGEERGGEGEGRRGEGGVMSRGDGGWGTVAGHRGIYDAMDTPLATSHSYGM